MDLIELSATDGRPRSLEHGLSGFVEGVARQVSDIPAGRSWDEFLEEVGALPGDRVPHRFREIISAQSERAERPDAPIEAVLTRWSEQEPTPFAMGLRHARMQRAEAVKPRRPAGEPSSAPREGGRKRASGSQSGRTGGAPRTAHVKDIDRYEFVRDQCLERLGRVGDKGLGEVVLIAGVRHVAKDRYPDMLPIEVKGVLKDLMGRSLVRYSAGRWSTPTHF